jgi:Ribonuclease G/E
VDRTKISTVKNLYFIYIYSVSDYYEAEKVMRENQHTVVVGSAMPVGTGSVKNATTVVVDGRQCGTITYNQRRGFTKEDQQNSTRMVARRIIREISKRKDGGYRG